MTHSLRFIASLLVLAVAGFANAADVTDKLTYTALGLDATKNAYETFIGKKITSSAVYAGNASSGTGQYIQLRTTNSNAGIVTTASGGTVKSITITFNTGTATGRKVDVYGSTASYSQATDLYAATTQGDLIGSATYPTDGQTVTITPSGTYTNIGLRSNSGALYIDKIDIVWNSDASNVVAQPKITGTNPFVGSTDVTLSADANSTIYYTTDGTDPSVATGTEYSKSFSLSASTTVKAIAVSGTNSSAITSVYFLKTANAGTATDPFTIAEARDVVDNKIAPATSYVAGTIYKITSSSDDILKYGNANYWIQTEGTKDTLEVYRGTGLGGRKITDPAQLAVGDNVVVGGSLSLYSNFYEIANGSMYSTSNAVVNDISDIKAEKDGDENAPLYNLSGQRVGKDYHGVVIKNGKKILNR